MRDDLLELICCPDCRGDLRLEGATRDEAKEIRSGRLVCAACGHVFPIDDGIPNLLPTEVREES